MLANEEVTADGRSERGNFPVYRRPLKQWMLRITAYADRLLADLDVLDWSESIKLMQRNWIGRSTGANIRFPVEGREDVFVEVFTTRPDTIFGATFMVLAPEHPLVDEITAFEWPGDDIFVDWESNPVDDWKGVFGITGTPADAVHRYREFTAEKSDLERQADTRDKTGVFTGGFVVNPVNDQRIPVFIADYVLMGYGTGAIMAVPGQDERDWEFAETYNLPIVRTVQPPDDFEGKAYLGDGPAINSGFLDGMDIAEAKEAIIAWLEANDRGARAVTYKLRDWLFSRQRYWGEPFPIVYDEHGPVAVPETMLPVVLPEIRDFEPTTSDDPDALPEPPLGARLGLGRGRARPRTGRSGPATGRAGRCTCARRTRCRSGPDRVGTTCATSTPPTRTRWSTPPSSARGRPAAPVSTARRRPVSSTCTSAASSTAVLHLLYARFWHKVLFDLGFVSTPEPFQRLVNQGYILAPAYTDERGMYVEASEVEERDGQYFHGRLPSSRASSGRWARA